MKNKNELLHYLKSVTILYVEDNDEAREELVYFLEKRVKKLYSAPNGKKDMNYIKR